MQDYISGVAPPVREQPRTVSAPSRHDQRSAPTPVTRTEEVTPTAQNIIKPADQVKEQVSLDELAEMLRKVNLTFDLFEIAAEYSIEEESRRVNVVIRNTRTGEVIRRVPPAEFTQNLRDIRDGLLGMHINASV